MAAGQAVVQAVEEFRMDMAQGKIGRNLSFEIRDITFDSDKTIELTTSLSTVLGVFQMEVNAAVSTTAFHLGSDCVVTSGAITVSTIGNNTLTFRVLIIGYK